MIPSQEVAWGLRSDLIGYRQIENMFVAVNPQGKTILDEAVNGMEKKGTAKMTFDEAVDAIYYALQTGERAAQQGMQQQQQPVKVPPAKSATPLAQYYDGHPTQSPPPQAHTVTTRVPSNGQYQAPQQPPQDHRQSPSFYDYNSVNRSGVGPGWDEPMEMYT
eukprot:CAMPEP_0184314698 /NCGR_PEP_ID=MMETSP1049-20130417/76420_1 /TAXON_ID=77928 /ORGANISM="Proteomonas sulcata, Strain CCMP704" /LENGTH=161 /DNA_ID=CAMNT_0026632743 /DNA_START=11 /DNA_END=496 /DNA_ORIENTATION=-